MNKAFVNNAQESKYCYIYSILVGIKNALRNSTRKIKGLFSYICFLIGSVHHRLPEYIDKYVQPKRDSSNCSPTARRQLSLFSPARWYEPLRPILQGRVIKPLLLKLFLCLKEETIKPLFSKMQVKVAMLKR